MWFKKKTELEKLIISYGQDVDDLLQFARTVGKPTIEECTLDDIKAYYKALVEPQNSLHRRMEMMKAVRKFFREHRSRNCLRASQIWDNPLIYVGQNVIVRPMTEKEKMPRGRPIDVKMIKKVKFLIDEGGMTIRGIARAEGIDPKNVHKMYHFPKGYKNAKFVGKKFSTEEAIA